MTIKISDDSFTVETSIQSVYDRIMTDKDLPIAN